MIFEQIVCDCHWFHHSGEKSFVSFLWRNFYFSTKALCVMSLQRRRSVLTLEFQQEDGNIVWVSCTVYTSARTERPQLIPLCLLLIYFIIFSLDPRNLLRRIPLKHVSKSSGHEGPSLLFFFFFPWALCRVLIRGHLKAAFHPWPWQTAAEKKTRDMIWRLQAALIHDVAFLVSNSETFFQGCSFSLLLLTVWYVAALLSIRDKKKKKNCLWG